MDVNYRLPMRLFEHSTWGKIWTYTKSELLMLEIRLVYISKGIKRLFPTYEYDWYI